MKHGTLQHITGYKRTGAIFVNAGSYADNQIKIKGDSTMKEKTIKIEPLEETMITLVLVGDTDLILRKKARSYEREEVYKQSMPKGTEIPMSLVDQRNQWEKLITSISWENPIVFHDDDQWLYTEEEWKDYMRNNRPCILAPAFYRSFAESFKSFGYKDRTGKAGTDFQRALNIIHSLNPITFESASPESKLVPNTGISSTNVVCHQNVFSNWSCELMLSVADIAFPYESVISIISTAGKYIGIGAQRKYGYGRYHIESIKAV